MPEYYKKVVCIQFTLTDEERNDISKGQRVFFEGHLVHQSSGGRYHILFPLGDRLFPVHEIDWIVSNPAIEIKRDHEFRSQFILLKDIDPVALSNTLDVLMKDRNH